MLNFIVFVLTALEVLTALLLIGIILIQQSKAGGGLGAVGGGVTETVFGATAGNVLTKGTVILASFFFVITLLLAIITGQGQFGKSVADGISTEPDAPLEATAVSSDVDDAKPDAESGAVENAEAVTEAPESDVASPAKGEAEKAVGASSEPKPEPSSE